MGSDGDVLVLDMGQPVKIVSMAQTLIQLSGRSDVRIEFTGLRPGEKLTEELFGLDDPVETEHELIRSVSVPPLDPTDLGVLNSDHDGELVAWLRSRSAGAEDVLRTR